MKKKTKGIHAVIKKSQERFIKKQQTPAVELRNLLIDFGGVVAVNNVNLKINQGELVTLLGPSGCGKTTTLNAIAGLLKPTSGMILFKGKDVTSYAPQKRKLGLVFQNYALYPHMSVYKNIAFPLLNDEAWQSNIQKENAINQLNINKIIFRSNGAPEEEIEKLNKVFFDVYDVKREVYSQLNKYESRTKLDFNTLTAKKQLLKPHYKTALKEINDWALSKLDKIEKLEKAKKASGISELKKQIKLRKIEAKNLFINSDKELTNKLNEAKRKLVELKYSENIRLLKANKNAFPKQAKNRYNLLFKSLKEKYTLNTSNLNEKQKELVKEWKTKIIKMKDAIHKAIMEVAKRVEITQNLQKMPTKLSGGQQQRAAIARGIVKNPDILLMDEPLSNLDAKLRIQTRNWIRSIQRELGITLIFVTHDQEEAMAISDKIVCLHDGDIQQIGAPLELYEKPKNEFVAKFLGMPEMKIIPAEVSSTGVIKLFGKKLGTINKTTKVNVGVRADDFIESTKGLIKGTIEEIEYLGKEIRAVVKLEKFGNTSVTLLKKTSYNIGDLIKFDIKTKKLHFFNGNTKERLDV